MEGDMDMDSVARTGRVRKKSAKVLEMEEAEQLEKFMKSPVKKARLSDSDGMPKLQPAICVSPGGSSDIKSTPMKKWKVKSEKGPPGSSEECVSQPQVQFNTDIEESQLFKIKKEEPPKVSAPELLAALSQAPVSLPDLDPDLTVQRVKVKKKKKVEQVKVETEASEEEEDGEDVISVSSMSSGEGTHGGSSDFSPEPPVYSDTHEAAHKVKTLAERKAPKVPKIKKPKEVGQDGKPVKKRGATAYTMWCSSYRHKVVEANPGIDFASISKRLGEIWHGLPAKEKMGWKRKAKRLQQKRLSGMITTGKKTPPKEPPVLTKITPLYPPPPRLPMLGQGDGLDTSTGTPAASGAVDVGQAFKLYKVTSCSALDVAAHLKLLGESLSVIGARLQEHRGQIAVQGTLSVLLDSLLCAMGPLACLTTQLPETDGCPADVHSKTLDNIAYIMPVG